eukprot:7372266-Alexandrium_andersonii.AAC.1
MEANTQTRKDACRQESKHESEMASKQARTHASVSCACVCTCTAIASTNTCIVLPRGCLVITALLANKDCLQESLPSGYALDHARAPSILHGTAATEHPI